MGNFKSRNCCDFTADKFFHSKDELRADVSRKEDKFVLYSSTTSTVDTSEDELFSNVDFDERSEENHKVALQRSEENHKIMLMRSEEIHKALLQRLEENSIALEELADLNEKMRKQKEEMLQVCGAGIEESAKVASALKNERVENMSLYVETSERSYMELLCHHVFTIWRTAMEILTTSRITISNSVTIDLRLWKTISFQYEWSPQPLYVEIQITIPSLLIILKMERRQSGDETE